MKVINKLNESLNSYRLNGEKLTRNQLYIFLFSILFTLILKYFLIPYNMIDHGEGATRTWNALWWAQNPFFVEPLSGNPGWFFLMGPLIMLTKEIFYTPLIMMILAVTLGGIYIFKITLLLLDFKTSILAFFVFTFNPIIIRLNYVPVPQQFYLAAMCIMIYYFIKASCSRDEKLSRKYFIISGIFSFIGILFRPEALFVLVSFCILALLIKKKGKYYYIFLTLLFQIIWMGVSYKMYGSFFKTFEEVRTYDYLVGTSIESGRTLLRLKGFFLPYYFIVLGITFILFYFFIKGTIISYKKFPFIIILILMISTFVPAVMNGISGSMSTQYHTTRYFYLTFYFSSLFAAIGLNSYLNRFSSNAGRSIIAGLVILTAVPLSYIKEFVPAKYNKLFPKVIQFMVTTTEPKDSWEMIKFIDENIGEYASLIFDSSESDSSIMYVPFRTKLAPPDKVMISNYNIPDDKEGLSKYINDFMKKNGKGIVMFRKNPTLMNGIFTEALAKKNLAKELKIKEETEKWVICTYE